MLDGERQIANVETARDDHEPAWWVLSLPVFGTLMNAVTYLAGPISTPNRHYDHHCRLPNGKPSKRSKRN